ncbi:hypothetical protein [Prochlorococcus sp. MIT 0801]|uniref:hypothetical protein n=1 Tax=Prochlorococcus sp. MIT 0801 TaxID=1501269 RepID=UPI0004F84298|nr:hypothetical protein [Prochlorococcus sp. MIT 0801]AIQ96187.1 hypothetical protein EW15_0095 [Prochlorococcus sp. MIT 0801]
MRVAMDTGMRTGSLRKLKWSDIGENTAIPEKKERSGSKLMCQLRRPKQVGLTGLQLPLPSSKNEDE